MVVVESMRYHYPLHRLEKVSRVLCDSLGASGWYDPQRLSTLSQPGHGAPALVDQRHRATA